MNNRWNATNTLYWGMIGGAGATVLLLSTNPQTDYDDQLADTLAQIAAAGLATGALAWSVAGIRNWLVSR
ncbi:MAG: hypothetical protein EXQ89_03675 [Rhodospirillaceae bacterium]|nr:hypothetical protein [Rhodospirillaceae bacterium]